MLYLTQINPKVITHLTTDMTQKSHSIYIYLHLHNNKITSPYLYFKDENTKYCIGVMWCIYPSVGSRIESVAETMYHNYSL